MQIHTTNPGPHPVDSTGTTDPKFTLPNETFEPVKGGGSPNDPHVRAYERRQNPIPAEARNPAIDQEIIYEKIHGEPMSPEQQFDLHSKPKSDPSP